jgi:quinol monooxygenase YgiN
MAVLIIAEVKGQTREGYDGMLNVLEDILRAAPGLILHTSHPTEDGWRVVEVWESKAEADQFFAKNVAPNLPPGITPKRSVEELHGFVTP